MLLKLRATLLILLSIAVLFTVFGSVAGAQGIDGRLRGEVTDPSGAVVAGAKVTATNVATNISTETTTSASGTYSFPNLLPGVYKVTVEVGGFTTYTRDQVQVRTNQVTEVSPRLAIQGATAEVGVTTGAEIIQLDPQLVNTFDATQIVNLPFTAPLGANAVLNLATLAPGTTTQGAAC
jgi:hypothetical protein